MGIFLIWLSVRSIDAESWEHMKTAFREIKYEWLILSACIATLSHVSRAIRWKMLLDTFGKKVRLDRTFYSLMIGYFFNLAVPRMGEAARAGFINQYEKIPIDKTFGTIISDRAFDLITLGILTLLLTFLEFDVIGNFAINDIFMPIFGKISTVFSQNIVFLVLAIVIGLLVLFLVGRYFKAFINKLKGFTKSIIEGVLSVRKVKSIPAFIFHSIFIWVCYFFMVYCVFFALDGTSHLGPVVGLGILCFGTFGVIIAPGGLGAYPYIVSNFLLLYGVNLGVGVAFGWVTWGIQTILVLIFGFISLILLPLTAKKDEESGIDTAENSPLS